MRRQRVDVLLPGEGGSPDVGGVKQQFAAARSMVEATLLRLKQLPQFQACAYLAQWPQLDSLCGEASKRCCDTVGDVGSAAVQGRLDAQWLDQEDCVGAWQSASLAAVVLPTANTLAQVSPFLPTSRFVLCFPKGNQVHN